MSSDVVGYIWVTGDGGVVVGDDVKDATKNKPVMPARNFDELNSDVFGIFVLRWYWVLLQMFILTIELGEGEEEGEERGEKEREKKKKKKKKSHTIATPSNRHQPPHECSDRCAKWGVASATSFSNLNIQKQKQKLEKKTDAGVDVRKRVKKKDILPLFFLARQESM